MAPYKNLILVAGYPKSGSTWVRFVFEALRLGRTLSLNDMEGGFYGARRRLLFDDFAPVNAGDLLPAEIDDLLPEVFRRLAARTGGPHIVKVHDAAVRTCSGQWLYPPECVRSVIYLTRHPFDVAVSYAHHLGISIPRAVTLMGRDDSVTTSQRRLRPPLHEHVNSWSGNISAWLAATDFEIIPARYEDLFENPAARFSRLARGAGFTASESEITRACEAAQFERLRGVERSAGFIERPRSSPAFFRAGRPHSWEGALDENLRAKLVENHGSVMARLGYDGGGNASATPEWNAIA